MLPISYVYDRRRDYLINGQTYIKVSSLVSHKVKMVIKNKTKFVRFILKLFWLNPDRKMSKEKMYNYQKLQHN